MADHTIAVQSVVTDIIRIPPPTGPGTETAVRKGMVFIPDIGGFTQLVRNTDPVQGRTIIVELLSTLIDQNIMGLEIAEIEGDAVFFYKWQALPSIEEIVAQFDALKGAFDQRRGELEDRYKIHLDLHLKAVAHFGDMSEFFLGGFKKLYGEVVVEAHRLLKNGIREDSYLLLTNAFINAASQDHRYREHLINGPRSGKACELYGGLPSICFTYIHYDRTWTRSA